MIDFGHDDVERLRLSVRSFGFGALSDAIAPPVLRELQNEAEELNGTAGFAEGSEALKYKAQITSLGPRAKALLCSRQMTELLFTLFGDNFLLTEGRSCLTFYKEGDHLGPHLDKPAAECAVTIIVYVAVKESTHPSDETGLQLRVYGQEITEAPQALLTIPTCAGSIVVGHGSRYWHERPMLQPGEQVAALTGCYSYSTDNGAGRD